MDSHLSMTMTKTLTKRDIVMLYAEEISPPFQITPEKRLAYNVLERAIRDVSRPSVSSHERGNAIEFLRSDSYEIMSVRWLCEAVDFDYETFRSLVEKVIAKTEPQTKCLVEAD